MDSTEIVVFSCVLGGIFLLFSVAFLILWARQNGLVDLTEARCERLEQRSEPKALLEARAVAESTADRVDSAMTELRKFREGVHAEVQRLYAIMRRQEKAVQVRSEEPEKDEEEFPDEIEPPKQEETTGSQVSKADLRALARKRGLL